MGGEGEEVNGGEERRWGGRRRGCEGEVKGVEEMGGVGRGEEVRRDVEKSVEARAEKRGRGEKMGWGAEKKRESNGRKER